MTPGEPTFQARTRLVLVAGFGGLLALMAVGGFDAIQVLQQIQGRNIEIRRAFLSRNRALEQIRSSLYLSGTFVRDYLLDPEPGGAELQRGNLQALHRGMEAALDRYAGSLSAEEENPMRALRIELAAYWKVLDPILRWSP